jgi:superfamily II DNA/RNA helicase
LIVFTEYKTTLDYVVQRLEREFGADSGAIIQLYGGMSDEDRERIKLAFNDPDSPVQILVATDAASEGLNLQHTARLLMHFEIPWNPSRLEQRNGRIDRHGQSRDVTIYHFASDDDADLAFVARVLEKVNDIREDLGSVGELFDAAFQRRMMEFNDDKTCSRNWSARSGSARPSRPTPGCTPKSEAPKTAHGSSGCWPIWTSAR